MGRLTEKKKMKGFKGFVPVCCVCVSAWIFQRPHTEWRRQSITRTRTSCSPGWGLEGLDRKRKRPREKKESKISSNVWTWRQFTNRNTWRHPNVHIIRKSLQVRNRILFSNVCLQGTTKFKWMFPQRQCVWLDDKLKRKYIFFPPGNFRSASCLFNVCKGRVLSSTKPDLGLTVVPV